MASEGDYEVAGIDVCSSLKGDHQARIKDTLQGTGGDTCRKVKLYPAQCLSVIAPYATGLLSP